MGLFIKLNKIILKSMRKNNRLRTVKNSEEKPEWAEGMTSGSLSTAMITKAILCWLEDGQAEHGERNGEAPKSLPHPWERDIDRADPEGPWREDGLCNECSWGNWLSVRRRRKSDIYFIPYAKVNLEWIKDLSVKVKTWREDIGEPLYGPWVWRDCSNKSWKRRSVHVGG